MTVEAIAAPREAGHGGEGFDVVDAQFLAGICATDDFYLLVALGECGLAQLSFLA